MGEMISRQLAGQLGIGRPGGPSRARWFWHHQLKKPFFGRFMKPWRWPADVPEQGWERVRIESRSQSLLHAIVARTDRAEVHGVVVCAHPMGLACKGFWLRQGHARRLLDAGFHVVAFDFNGFGESPSTNFDYPGDALSVGLWARAAFPGLPLHALTASFGAINTLSAIDDRAFPFERIVAEGCPPTLPDFWKAYPFAHAVLRVGGWVDPAGALRINPAYHLQAMRDGVDVLLVHSRADRWTPVEFGDVLEQSASRPHRVRRLTLDSADHTHGLRDEPDRYWSAVLEFLTLSNLPAKN